MLHSKERASLVDRNSAVPRLDRALGNGLVGQDAGVVNQDVDAAVFRFDILNDLLPVTFLGDIQAHALNVGAELLLRLSQVADHNLRALLGKQIDNRAANALVTARDQGYFVFQSHFYPPVNTLRMGQSKSPSWTRVSKSVRSPDSASLRISSQRRWE